MFLEALITLIMNKNILELYYSIINPGLLQYIPNYLARWDLNILTFTPTWKTAPHVPLGPVFCFCF